MTSCRRYGCSAILVGLAAVNVSYAQVGSINSIAVHSREYNDVPGSSLTTLSSYPSIVYFGDKNVSAPAGFANRHVWRFSADGGTTAYQFKNDQQFQVSMTLTLTADPTAPRKEAGFLFDTAGGQGQFIVNSDAHEVVAFGGPLPFYAFPSTFQSGDTITLGMTYFLDENGKMAVIYSANDLRSPAQEFSNLEQGIIDNTTLGGYLQVVNSGANPANFGTATFQNIRIGAVPEPSVLALLGVGALGLLLRRRRN